MRAGRPIAVLVWVGLAVGYSGCSSHTLVPGDAGEPGAEETTPKDGGDPAGNDDSNDVGGADPGGCPAAGLPLSERGLLAPGQESGPVELATCSRDAWVTVIPRGMKVAVRLQALGSHLLVGAVSYPDDSAWQDKLASFSASPSVPGGVEFTSPRSGEFLIQVRSLDPERPSAYSLQIDCLENCSLRCSRYPLLLVHGWTGFKSIGPTEYFYNVPDDLSGLGFLPLVAVLDPYNSVEIRSEQLAAQIDDFMVQSHSRRLDIIAHSQGGLDARRAISTLGYGDRVAALVTVATPHHGTPIADIALGLLPGPAEDALAFLLNLLGASGGHESDALASFQSLTTSYLEDDFNPRNPDDERVEYISYTGLTCPLGVSCGDICDVEIRWAYDLIYLQAGDNDGMVPVSSGQWGEFRGTIPADHFDEVGQVAGVTGPNFDHLEFYRSLADLLCDRGH